MFLIWRGWGILAFLIPFVFLILAQLGLDLIYSQNYYTLHSSEIAPLALLLSTPLIYFIGNKLNNKPGKLLIDPETNEEVILKEKHDLFWIPLQYWSFIIATITIFMYALDHGLI